MPTTLGQPFALDWRGDPPHMLKPDVPVWYRFLEKYGHLFEKLYYDCLLGGPTLSPEQEKDPFWKMHRMTLSKRADAIAELKDRVWIIEVTAVPGLRAIGQLMTYRALWIEDTAIAKPEDLVLVAEASDQDMLSAATLYGIQIYIV
jgi:hypothetical protein